MAFCNNCGNQIPDGAYACPYCGTAVNAQAGAPGSVPYGAPYTPQVERKSEWNGGVLETVVASIVASLMVSITCGIAAPWAVAYLCNFIVSHAVIDGKKVKFDGTGGQLFGNWLKWLLLTVVTCGIYSFWVAPRMYNWIASHIHIEG